MVLRYVKTIVFAVAVVLLAGVAARPARAEVSFDFAYSNLSQHGSWLVSGQYGRVWQPREYTRDWNPYYDGHWVDTDMGWTWVSDYEWGSLPYHYGTWVSDPRYGWVWIPGEVWAPSWVVFRTSPEYIGWAPVPPGFSVGVSIEFGAPSSFIFVSSRDFMAPRLRTAIIPAARTNVFINNTTVINNIVIQNNVVINRGPDVRIIERAIGRPVQRQQIEQVARVAPFANVSRAQLAVTPERVKRGLRVAEPVPESRPLPVADSHGRPNDQAQKPSGEAAPVAPSSKAEERQQGRKDRFEPKPKQDAQQPQAPAGEAAPVAPSNKAEERQQGRKVQPPAGEAAPVAPSNKAEERQQGRPSQPPARTAAPAPPAEPKPNANAEQPPKAPPKAKAKAKPKKDETNDPDKKDQSPQ
jgi:hypothetical protein